MVKNIIKIAIAVLLCCIMLFGCSTEVDSDNTTDRFDTIVDNDGCDIIVDKETGIMYLSRYDRAIIVMIDVDGMPLIYKGG